MLYELHFLSQEDLERLYIHETWKLQSAIALDLPHNEVHCMKLNLEQIQKHLDIKQE